MKGTVSIQVEGSKISVNTSLVDVNDVDKCFLLHAVKESLQMSTDSWIAYAMLEISGTLSVDALRVDRGLLQKALGEIDLYGD